MTCTSCVPVCRLCTKSVLPVELRSGDKKALTWGGHAVHRAIPVITLQSISCYPTEEHNCYTRGCFSYINDRKAWLYYTLFELSHSTIHYLNFLKVFCPVQSSTLKKCFLSSSSAVFLSQFSVPSVSYLMLLTIFSPVLSGSFWQFLDPSVQYFVTVL